MMMIVFVHTSALHGGALASGALVAESRLPHPSPPSRREIVSEAGRSVGTYRFIGLTISARKARAGSSRANWQAGGGKICRATSHSEVGLETPAGLTDPMGRAPGTAALAAAALRKRRGISGCHAPRWSGLTMPRPISGRGTRGLVGTLAGPTVEPCAIPVLAGRRGDIIARDNLH